MSAQNTHSGVGTIILIFNNKSMISVYWVKYKTRWTISMNDVERLPIGLLMFSKFQQCEKSHEFHIRLIKFNSEQ